MAYLALYRKWRPRTFDEVVGQKHISIPIMRALKQGRLAHAYLFSGPRGTGKTSMARILAKAVNCLNIQDGNPCNNCGNCNEINNGSSMDVYEIDGASARGVDEIIRIRKSIPTLPVTGKKKVYIIDEVHMLTKEAFNALLKTLEEPPAHVLFILATTEPGKIPLTILSRCQRYEFHRISVTDIKEHLLLVAEKSGIRLTPEAADLIAVRAEGGLRDALSLLDQCSSSASDKELSSDIVYTLLGLTRKDQIISLSHHIFSSKSGEALQLFYQILQNGKEPAAVFFDLLEHFRCLMISKINPNAPELSAYGHQIQTLKDDANQISEFYLDALFSSLHQTISDIKRSSSPRMTAEMGLLRLCRIKGSQELNSLAERVERLEKSVSALCRGNTLIPASNHPEAPTNSTRIISDKNLSSPEAIRGKKEDKEQATPTDPEQKVKNVIPSSKSETKASPFINPDTYPALWSQFTDYLQQIHRIDIWSCVQKGTLILINNNRVVASLPQQFLVLGANNKGYQNLITEAFRNITGRELSFHAVLKGSDEESAAIEEAKKYAFQTGDPSPDINKEQAAKDNYKLISEKDIESIEKEEPVLSAALKIISNCDIYKKEN